MKPDLNKIWAVLEDMNLHAEPGQCSCPGKYDHKLGGYQFNQTYYNNCTFDSCHDCICRQLMHYIIRIPDARKLCRANTDKHKCSCCYYSDMHLRRTDCLAVRHNCTCSISQSYCKAGPLDHICLCRNQRFNPFCRANIKHKSHECRCKLDLTQPLTACRCNCSAIEHHILYGYDERIRDYVEAQKCSCNKVT